MPRTGDSAPPEVMTWVKASPVLIVATIFWALQAFFELFWFFGPALAGLYCTSKVSAWVGSLGGLTAAACTAAGGVAGYFSAPALIAFGAIMAMAIGFMGWLVIGGWLLMTNRRIFDDNALWFMSGLAVSEIPFVNALPGLVGSLLKMYANQIKKDKECLKRREAERAAQLAQERAQTAVLMQAQAEAPEPAAIY